MKAQKVLSLVLAVAMFLVMAPVVSAQEAPTMDIVDIAASNEDFSTLVTAVQIAGLVDALKGEGPFTVFAPTNAAFEALPEGTLEALVADPSGDLTDILLYHVLSGKVMAADVTDGLEAPTLLGENVKFSTADGVKINDANIIATDIEATNGVIHVIDAVILPPAPAGAAQDTAEAAAPGTIVDIAVSNPDFSKLVAAVSAAGLVDALNGEGPFTVFAPTNAAFEALPAGTLDALLADPSGDLTDILLYHVLSGKVMAADVTDGLEAPTLLGETVRFSTMDGVKINDANIVATDIEASNGVIHVIDAVILPPAGAEEPVAVPAALPTTGGSQSSLPMTLAIAGGLLALLVTGAVLGRKGAEANADR